LFAAALGLMFPAAAGARGRARLESSVSEASATSPLQESSTEQPPASGPAQGSSPATRREERRARRKARDGGESQGESGPSARVTPQVTISSPSAGTELFTGGGRATRARANDDALTNDEGAVTFTGTVAPADAGTTVALQREYRRGAWHRIGGGVVDGEGRFSIVHTFFRPGDANIRVLAHFHGRGMRSVSAPVNYRISRRRHRQVTIQASADPIAYGLAVTITGTVAGAPSQPVSLLAQTGQGTFAQVAETSTSSGQYSFTESPQQSTRYRVSTASASSAVLSEAVTYALTATPSPSSLPAGGKLTFTGTLAPAHEGQVVELERHNSPGEGYAVIATGTLTSATAYAITHSFLAAGTELLRITVPGDGEVEGVSSEPFSLEVTSSL
jgi:hypothetical protein